MSRITLFRAAFFGVVAVDSVLSLPRAALYGQGGFDVAHFRWLDGLISFGPETVIVPMIIVAWLAALVAVGAAGRVAVAGIAALYGLVYFSSLVDAYQHHYLVFWLLVIFAAFDWRDPDRAPRWPLRLALIQLSIVYGWSAVAKMDPLWLDGSLLEALFAVPEGERARRVVEGIAHAGAVTPSSVWAALAVLVLVLEVGLAGSIHVTRLRGAATVCGLGMHLGIEWAGFEIERFGLYMAAMYLLVAPDRWLAALERLPVRPVPHRTVVAHGAALLLLAGSAWAGNVPRDYQATLGSVRRALGDDDGALDAWKRMLGLDPDYTAGWVNLGDLHLERDEPEAALAAFRRARALEDSPEIAAREVRVAARLEPPKPPVPPPCAKPCHDAAIAAIIRGDFAEAARQHARACEADVPGSCTALGGLVANGRGVARDDARAARLYRKACDADDLAGCSNLGHLLWTGRGLARDREQALELWRRGCGRGEPFACRQLRQPP